MNKSRCKAIQNKEKIIILAKAFNLMGFSIIINTMKRKEVTKCIRE